MIRLGDGTAESHRRAQSAIDDLWAFTGELFHADQSDAELIASGIAVDPGAARHLDRYCFQCSRRGYAETSGE
jgi:ring-1,2-phenylacetyl-CoA epoxidase subunit PaaC